MRSGALRSEARGRGFGPGAPSRAPRALVPLIIIDPEGGFAAGGPCLDFFIVPRVRLRIVGLPLRILQFRGWGHKRKRQSWKGVL